MNSIKINERIRISKNRSEKQQCLYCGQIIGKDIVCIDFNNASDELSIIKNLKLHVNCVKPLQKTLNQEINNNLGWITINSI